MRYLSILLLLLVVVSCKNYTKENQELRNELRSLEYELSSIQGSPGCMLGEAFESLEQGKYEEAIEKIKEVKESFPEWNENVMDELILIVEKETAEASRSSD